MNNSKLNADSQIGFVSFQDRESARNAKEQAPRQLFKNRRLIVNFCEPRESRRISLEEQFDKRAYQRQRVMNVRSQNSDLLALINSIGLLLNFSGNGIQANQVVGGGGGMASSVGSALNSFGGNNNYRSHSYNRGQHNGQQRQFTQPMNNNSNFPQQQQQRFNNRNQQRGGSLQPNSFHQRQ